MEIKKIAIFILAVATFGAGVYFKDDIVELYNSAGRQVTEQVKNFQETDIGSVVSEAGKQFLTPTPLKVGGKESQVVLLKSKIIEETNLQRQQNGLPALKENVLLSSAASAKANDMFKNQYFEHESPDGIGPAELVQNYGYDYIVAGENLILGNFSSEKEVVDNWMASPGHRENILNSRFSEIGAAIIKGTYKGDNVWIGVQEFGLPLTACPQPDDELKTQIDLNKAQLDVLSLQIDERKEQINKTNPKSSAYKQMIDDYNQLIAQYNLLAEEVKVKISQYNTQANIFNACVGGN